MTQHHFTPATQLSTADSPHTSLLRTHAPGNTLATLTDGPGRRRVLIAVLSIVGVTIGGFALRSVTAEMPLLELLSRAHTGIAQTVTLAVYAGLEPPIAITLAALISVAVWARFRSLRVGLWFGLSVGLAWLPVWIVKQLVARARPDALLLAHPLTPTPHDMGYPSGHTAFITVLVVMLFTISAGSAWRVPVVSLGVLAVATVAASVLFDGVHYPTDVVASCIWGLAVTPAVTRWLARRLLPPADPAA